MSAKARPTIQVKRVYAAPGADDGCRVLVDRLWPRGISRAAGRIDLWLKEIAPSDGLRKRVHGDPAYPGADAAWVAFTVDYAAELAGPAAAAAVRQVLDEAARGPVTLLYGAKDEARNNAVALRDWLLGRLE